MTTGQLTWAALAAWCLAILGLGAAGAFAGPPGFPPLALAAGAVVPLTLFTTAYLSSSAFRDFVLSADLRLVAGIQAWRWAGLGFLSLWAYGVLPGLFAWTAGLGDMAVGFTAPWMALALARDRVFAGSRRFALFNWLGILDLTVALSLGGLSAVLLHGRVTTAPMAQLPLVLIPAFLVPLFLMLHITALLQARRASVRHTVASPAAA
jgi:hypothetical protein